MCKLKKKIKQLDLTITTDRAMLSEYTRLLNVRLADPEFLTFAVIAGFTFGFILEYKASKRLGHFLMTSVPSFLKQAYHNFTIITALLL